MIKIRPRKLISKLKKELENPTKKVLFLWGPRQVGKSTVLNLLREKYHGAYFNFDNLEDQRLFIPELEKLKASVSLRSANSDSKIIFIDEIQNYPESTRSIKLLCDQTDYVILATGSSELRAKTNNFDTLAGRYHEFTLFPLTIDEMAVFDGKQETFLTAPDFAHNQAFQNYLEVNMVYGSYPGVFLSENKIPDLKNIVQNSIIKDIVNIYDLKSTDLVFNLLRLLAMQIGNLVNVTKISSELGSTKSTIDNYLSILEKNKIIYFLEPFRTNRRRAYLERKKVYFYDLGVRNTLIDDFRSIAVRQDLGAVFENLIIIGALRQTVYSRNNNKLLFFREIGGAQNEMDLIIETPSGDRNALEIKFTGGRINRFPDLDFKSYGLVSRENAAEFLI